MNSRDYWRQREKENQLKILEAQKNYDKELKRIYDQVQLNIQRDINNFYAKYYNQKQGWTLADVKKSVSEFDVKEFESKAKEYVKNKDFSAEANERLKLYNLTMKVNRLEMLKADIGLEMLKGSDDLDKHVKESLLKEAKEEAERQAGILGRTVKSLDFSEKSLKGLINGSWQQTSFSDRIWGYNDKLKGILDGMIPQMIIQGKHPTALTKDLNRIFGSARFEAERLLRTESSRVYGEMAKDAIGKAGYKEYEWIAEPKACDVCGPMNGKIFDTKNAEFGKSLFPMHPNCRCAIIPVIPDFDIDDYLEQGNAAIDKAMKDYNGNNAEDIKKSFDGMMENLGSNSKNVLDLNKAVLDTNKFTKYLLTDAGKSSGWVDLLGYELDNWEELRNDFLEKSKNPDKVTTVQNQGFGVKYIYDILDFKNGVPASIVWQIDEGTDFARLVTAYINTKLRKDKDNG